MKNKLILFGLIGFFIIGLTLIINKSERPNKQTLNWFNGNLEEAQASLDENQIIMLDFYINNSSPDELTNSIYGKLIRLFFFFKSILSLSCHSLPS